MLDLITDRTGGAYYYTDLNRVGVAVAYLRGLLNEYGIPVAVEPKQDWTMLDFPTPANMAEYLKHVAAIRAALPVLPATPQLPASMAYLTYQGANDIEKILFDINYLIEGVVGEFILSGDISCGEDDWA